VLFVQVDEYLGVAVRPETVARALQVAAQFAVVVDLTVLNDVDGLVLVGHRLVARLEVDDREPARRETDALV
jgi:hypothetical protein